VKESRHAVQQESLSPKKKIKPNLVSTHLFAFFLKPIKHHFRKIRNLKEKF
jgi:hypothetical protein